MDEIINKVAQSGLVEFNLEDYYPKGERVLFDIKDHLFQGLVLREKDFREFVKTENWSSYSGKNVAIICSADAIVPTWAYMLLATALAPFTSFTAFGNLEMLETALFYHALNLVDAEKYRGQKIVIKGCSNLPVPVSAYVEITRILRPVAQSLMYGEPCSTVPLFKKPK
ncbi:MAG TPA: DUF2480 family protein [Bacteroidia bacterium]|jgi:hypothetical protein|nr:DUF2480 family protein [Bacteroidia bacterium]